MAGPQCAGAQSPDSQLYCKGVWSFARDVSLSGGPKQLGVWAWARSANSVPADDFPTYLLRAHLEQHLLLAWRFDEHRAPLLLEALMGAEPQEEQIRREWLCRFLDERVAADILDHLGEDVFPVNSPEAARPEAARGHPSGRVNEITQLAEGKGRASALSSVSVGLVPFHAAAAISSHGAQSSKAVQTCFSF